MKLCWVGLILCGLFLGCQNKPATNSLYDLHDFRIIGGQAVASDDPIFKSTVRILLFYQGTWYPSCTGVVIGTDLILTAAHCTSGITVSRILVAFGAQPLSVEMQEDPKTRIDPTQAFETRAVSKMVINPAFQVGLDLAVLRLKETIPSKAVSVEFLPPELLDKTKRKTVFDRTQQMVIIAGYGMISETPPTPSKVLRQVKMSVLFDGQTLVSDQSKGLGACQGDSGGPVFLINKGKNYLVGITKGSLDSKDCRHQGLFWNPSTALDFIDEAVHTLYAN